MSFYDIIFSDMTYRQQVNVSNFVTEANVSFTMDMNSQMTVKLLDPGLTFTNNNYFQIRRPVRFQGNWMEIASVSIEPGPGTDAFVTLECRLQGIQRLKRDKRPVDISAASATQFAAVAAAKAGLSFAGQESTVFNQIPTPTDEPSTDPSTFDVLQQLAGENNFVVFEAAGTLFFGSQEWLLNTVKWGRFAINYPYREQTSNGLRLMQMPGFRTSDDDPMAAEFQILLQRQNATQIRPGMSVYINGVDVFRNWYLVTEVSWDIGAVDLPVAVSGRTPIKYIVPQTQTA